MVDYTKALPIIERSRIPEKFLHIWKTIQLSSRAGVDSTRYIRRILLIHSNTDLSTEDKPQEHSQTALGPRAKRRFLKEKAVEFFGVFHLLACWRLRNHLFGLDCCPPLSAWQSGMYSLQW